MTTQTSNLRLILPVQGEFSGTWGDQVNAGLTNLVDTAIAGYTTVSVTTANQALTANNFTADQARTAILNLTTTTAANFAVYAPPAAKTYKVVNSSAYTATIYNSTVIGNTTAAGTGVAVPAGAAVTVLTNGTNFVSANSHIPSLTLGTALPIASGGTGATALTGLTVGTANALNTANSYQVTKFGVGHAAYAWVPGAIGLYGADVGVMGGFGGSNTDSFVTANIYYNSTDWATKTASTSAMYVCGGSGGHTWYSGSSVAAGAAPVLTNIMGLTSAGALTVPGMVTSVGLTTTGNIVMNGGAGSINIQITAASAVRGYVYADATGVGFLSSSATWGAYVPYGTVDWYSVGNVTAYSDERVKTNWRDLPSDFLTKLAGVKMGVYDRTDVELTQVGVSAQSLRPVLPNAVTENEEGQLSVAYGNAALTACIALARKVEELEARLAALGV